MPAKGKGRGRVAGAAVAEKTQENVVDSTTNQKIEEKNDIATKTANNAVDKKTLTKRKQNKTKDSVENGDSVEDVPVVPEKRGRGKHVNKTEPAVSVIPAATANTVNNKQDEQKDTSGKPSRGKRGGRNNNLKEKNVEEPEERQEEPIEAKSNGNTPNPEDEKPQTKKGRKKGPAATAATSALVEVQDEAKKIEPIPPVEAPQKNTKGRRVAAKKEKQSQVEKEEEPLKKGGRVFKAKKEIEKVSNGVAEEDKKPVKTAGAKKAVGGVRGRKRAAVDIEQDANNGHL